MHVQRFFALPVFGAASVLALSCALSPASTLSAGDWPRWRGPRLDGISQEKGWSAQWPGDGLPKLWEANVGVGYASFSVSRGVLYTMGNTQDTDAVYALDAAAGAVKWKYEYPCLAKDPNGYHGTRCTPTVDGDRVYTVSRLGHFFCFDAAKGTVIWSKDLVKDFGGKVPTWGYSGSPLVEGDWVLIECGGPGASVVAFAKKTGEVVWKNGDDAAGYASLIPFDCGGQRVFAQFSKDQIIGRRMKDGGELWRASWKTSYGVNAATPLIHGDEMFLSTGYGFGCALFKVSPDGVKEVWRNKNMKNHVNSCVWLGGYIYGFNEGELACLDAKTGETKWSNGSYGKGSLVAVDGKLLLYGQSGKLGLAEATPDGFKELASFQALTGRDTWAAPVLVNGRIYARSQEKLAAYNVSGK